MECRADVSGQLTEHPRMVLRCQVEECEAEAVVEAEVHVAVAAGCVAAVGAA